MERPAKMPPLSDPLDQRIAYLAALIARAQERELIAQERLSRTQERMLECSEHQKSDRLRRVLFRES